MFVIYAGGSGELKKCELLRTASFVFNRNPTLLKRRAKAPRPALLGQETKRTGDLSPTPCAVPMKTDSGHHQTSSSLLTPKNEPTGTACGVPALAR